jgi:thiamine pyrophosphate-dependent acetolactate synthase large subunit-like protein
MKTTYAEDKSEPDFTFGYYPARETVRLILHAIIKAKRPVVLVGNELSTTLGRELLSQFAEKMNVPVIAVHGKNDIMDNNNPLMMGAIGRLGSRKAMTYLKESDMVVALGTNMNPYTFSPYYGFEYNNLTENVILITLDPENIGSNLPISKNLFCSPESFLRVALGVIESEEYKFKGNAIMEFLNTHQNTTMTSSRENITVLFSKLFLRMFCLDLTYPLMQGLCQWLCSNGRGTVPLAI